MNSRSEVVGGRSSVGNWSQAIRVGIVGCGYWGSKHVRVMSTVPNVSKVVAVDRDSSVLNRLIELYPNIQGARSLDHVADQLDAVIVATPPRTHGSVARAALASGCHVMAEKPLSTCAAEAEALVALADRLGLVLMSGHTFEYNPAVWKLRELVQQGELGQLYHVYTERLNLGLFQGDVNVLWDLAPHDISILNYVLDSLPTSVSAWAGAHAHRQVEDVAYLQLHYSELGLMAQVHVSWLDPCKVRRVTVVGSKKMAVYNDLAEDERIKIFDKGVRAQDHVEHQGRDEDAGPTAYRQGGIECPYIEFDEPLAIEDRTFVESILSGRPPATDGRAGLRVVQILEAADRSHRQGQVVHIEYNEPSIEFDSGRHLVGRSGAMPDLSPSTSRPMENGSVAGADNVRRVGP